jgi:hypothetical protein
MTNIIDLALEIHHALDDAQVAHAFGGALALGYHVDEARGTRDIDINIWVPTTEAHRVLKHLPTGVEWSEHDVREVERNGQVRLFWGDTPVDVFFVTHPFHESASLQTEDVPFGNERAPILSANDLAVFKAFFDRTKDWADIEAMVDAQTIEMHVVLGWLVDLLGADDHRVERLRSLRDRRKPTSEPRFDP